MSKENNKICGTCKHWGTPWPHPGDVRLKAANCTAMVFPTVAKVVAGEGAHQFPGGHWAITLEDSFCAFFYQPKLQAISNWKSRPQAPAEALPVPVVSEPPKESA